MTKYKITIYIGSLISTEYLTIEGLLEIAAKFNIPNGAAFHFPDQDYMEIVFEWEDHTSLDFKAEASDDL